MRAVCCESPLNFNRNICLSSEPLERRVYRFKIWLLQIVCLWAHKLTSHVCTLCSLSRMQESVWMCKMCFRHYILFKLQIEHRTDDKLQDSRIPTPYTGPEMQYSTRKMCMRWMWSRQQKWQPANSGRRQIVWLNAVYPNFILFSNGHIIISIELNCHNDTTYPLVIKDLNLCQEIQIMNFSWANISLSIFFLIICRKLLRC